MADRRRRSPASLRRKRSRRLGAVLLVLLAGYLYVGPVRSYLDARSHTAAARQHLAQVMKLHAHLEARKRQLSTKSELVALARSHGYVQPGETPFTAPFADSR